MAKMETKYLYKNTHTQSNIGDGSDRVGKFDNQAPQPKTPKRNQNKSGGKHGLSGWENRAVRFPFKAQNS